MEGERRYAKRLEDAAIRRDLYEHSRSKADKQKDAICGVVYYSRSDGDLTNHLSSAVIALGKRVAELETAIEAKTSGTENAKT